jgi:hypothetical protein
MFSVSPRINILLCFFSAGILAIIGITINYYPAGNDLWDNHYLGMAMNFSEIQSFYNGFFPIGYSLLLKALVGNGYPAIAAFYVNVLLFLLMMITMSWLLKKQNLPGLFPYWLFMFIIFPRSFQYLITPGPDIAALALFTIGVALRLALCDSDKNAPMEYRKGPAGNPSFIPAIASGLAMGLGALVRYHVFVASIFFLFVLVVIMKRERKLILVSGAAFIAIYLPQVAVNVLSGHGPLETYHALNLYNLVYGVNWYHMEKLLPLPSAKSIVFGAPLLFIKHYAQGVASLGIFAIPPFVYGFLAKQENKKTGFAIGSFCMLYALFFGISASPRAVLLLIPVSMLFFMKIIFDSSLGLRTKRYAVVITLLCACFFIWKDGQRISFCKNQVDRYRTMESFFIANGVKNGQEVFTSDHDQYFRTLFPYRPIFNGGWGRMATYHYTTFYPELNVQSLNDFYSNCLRQKVRYVVFTADASKLADFCYGLYSEKLSDSRFIPVLRSGKNMVFRVASEERVSATSGK